MKSIVIEYPGFAVDEFISIILKMVGDKVRWDAVPDGRINRLVVCDGVYLTTLGGYRSTYEPSNMTYKFCGFRGIDDFLKAVNELYESNYELYESKLQGEKVGPNYAGQIDPTELPIVTFLYKGATDYSSSGKYRLIHLLKYNKDELDGYIEGYDIHDNLRYKKFRGSKPNLISDVKLLEFDGSSH